MLDKVSCGDCGEHIGWMIYTSPTGSFFCDVCAEKYEDEEKESENT
jgi:ribosomal protein S27E